MGRRLFPPAQAAKKRQYFKVPDKKQDIIRKMATGKFTISDIRKAAKVSYASVYAMVLRENLTVKMQPGTKAESEVNQKRKSNRFFNVNQQSWF